MKVRYAVIIERTTRNYAAYVPDLPGCVATARTKAAVERQIKSAITMHLQALADDGEPIPPPTTDCGYIETRVAV